MNKEPLVIKSEVHGETTAIVHKTVKNKSLLIRQYWPKMGTDNVFLYRDEIQAIVDYARANGIKIN